MAREPRYREPCGCVSTDTRWITLCPKHKREWRKLHDAVNFSKRCESDSITAARRRTSEVPS